MLPLSHGSFTRNIAALPADPVRESIPSADIGVFWCKLMPLGTVSFGFLKPSERSASMSSHVVNNLIDRFKMIRIDAGAMRARLTAWARAIMASMIQIFAMGYSALICSVGNAMRNARPFVLCVPDNAITFGIFKACPQPAPSGWIYLGMLGETFLYRDRNRHQAHYNMQESQPEPAGATNA